MVRFIDPPPQHLQIGNRDALPDLRCGCEWTEIGSGHGLCHEVLMKCHRALKVLGNSTTKMLLFSPES